MEQQEIRQLLAVVVAYDERNVGDAMLAAWYEAANRSGWTFNEAAEAVHTFFADSVDRLKPGHVTQLIRLHRTAAQTWMPEWCGECGSEWPDNRAEKNRRFRFREGSDGERVMCVCHPNSGSVATTHNMPV